MNEVPVVRDNFLWKVGFIRDGKGVETYVYARSHGEAMSKIMQVQTLLGNKVSIQYAEREALA